MARIKVKDIPRDQKISKDELKRVRGGAYEFYIKLPTLSYTKVETTSVLPNVGTTNIDPTITYDKW